MIGDALRKLSGKVLYFINVTEWRRGVCFSLVWFMKCKFEFISCWLLGTGMKLPRIGSSWRTGCFLIWSRSWRGNCLLQFQLSRFGMMYAYTKSGFEKIREWTCIVEYLWRNLVMEVVNDYLSLTVKEVISVLNLPWSLLNETPELAWNLLKLWLVLT